MEDLLEYISIYSQMNNIKFETLNHDKYMQGKKSKKQGRDSNKTHKKWKSISKADFASFNFTPRNRKMSENEIRAQSMKAIDFRQTILNAEISYCHSLLDKLADSVIILEEEQGKKEEPNFVFKMDYSKLYQVLFESTIQKFQAQPRIDPDDEAQTDLLKNIITSIHHTITTKTEDVIQAVDVLEYLIKILTQLTSKKLLKFTLKLLLEILKGDFIIKGERPFKSFY